MHMERGGLMGRLFLVLFLWFAVLTAAADDGEERFFLLSWPENREAVWYDLQIFPQEEFFGRKEMKPPVYRNSHVFRNGIILPGSLFSSYEGRGDLYFRVRGLDGAGEPFGAWSEAEKIVNDPSEERVVGILGGTVSVTAAAACLTVLLIGRIITERILIFLL